VFSAVYGRVFPVDALLCPPDLAGWISTGLAKGRTGLAPGSSMGATVGGPEYQELSDHPRVGRRNYFFLSVSLVNHSAQRCGGNAKRVINATMNKSTTMRKKRAIKESLLLSIA